VLRDDVQERSVEHIQHVETVCQKDTQRAFVGKTWRVCNTRRQARVVLQEVEREDALWISGDTWLILIGCLDFYHLNNFNSIISLEIIFYFFLPKFMIFFLYK